MLRVSKTAYGKIAHVEGAPSDAMLFYTFWQSHMWQDWAHHKSLGKKGDALTRDLVNVCQTLKEGRVLLLSDAGDKFEAAFDFAVAQCSAVGIEVQKD